MAQGSDALPGKACPQQAVNVKRQVQPSGKKEVMPENSRP